METLPRMIITGAGGFVGRRLLQLFSNRFEIHVIDRVSRGESKIPLHPNVHWHQVDIAEFEPMAALFKQLADSGGADFLLHFAAYYDFTGDDHPEFWRTNVEGMQNVVELSMDLDLKRFVFASSVAACEFPTAGKVINERTPPEADHIYARTKRIGEEILRDNCADLPSCIVRFAAMYSDWCEYPPLYVFLDTWLTKGWNARVLGGKGESAVPYLHVRDAAYFIQRVVEKADELEPCEVLNASTDGAISHRELFAAATSYFYGKESKPILMPKWLCGPGMRMRDLAGRFLGERPFERPWMAKYIDLKLTVDASRTRERLGWSPRPRLEIEQRLPFLLENMKTDPVEWMRRNREAMKGVRLQPNLIIYRLIDTHKTEISDALSKALMGPSSGHGMVDRYRDVAPEDAAWNHLLFLRNLMSSIRTRDRRIFLDYCADLAERRFVQGFQYDELAHAIRTLHDVTLEILGKDSQVSEMPEALHDFVTMTFMFGLDQINETYEFLESNQDAGHPPRFYQYLWPSELSTSRRDNR